MIAVSALAMPFYAYAHAAYFTLRSGGKVAVTLLFDSVYMWTIVIPAILLLTHGTSVNIHALFLAGNLAEMLKGVFGLLLLRRIDWANQLVADEQLKQ